MSAVRKKLPCGVEGCPENSRSLGMCRQHYSKFHLYGDPLKETRPGVKPRHGQSRSSEHGIWRIMRHRCECPTGDSYKNYGQRGISVCERWQVFENFLADMGPRPSMLHTIDRIDNNGNYEPGNCHWATGRQQANNRRSNRFLTHNGITLTVEQWAEKLNILSSTLSNRIVRNWTVERALTARVMLRQSPRVYVPYGQR